MAPGRMFIVCRAQGWNVREASLLASGLSVASVGAPSRDGQRCCRHSAALASNKAFDGTWRGDDLAMAATLASGLTKSRRQ